MWYLFEWKKKWINLLSKIFMKNILKCRTVQEQQLCRQFRKTQHSYPPFLDVTELPYCLQMAADWQVRGKKRWYNLRVFIINQFWHVTHFLYEIHVYLEYISESCTLIYIRDTKLLFEVFRKFRFCILYSRYNSTWPRNLELPRRKVCMF